MQIRVLEGEQTAKGITSAAKGVVLQGETAGNAEFEGLTLTLDGIRVYLHSNAAIPRLYLVARRGGYALYLQARLGPRVWLIAERSKQVRLFKRVETALAVCNQLEVASVVVMLHKPKQLQRDSDVLQV